MKVKSLFPFDEAHGTCLYHNFCGIPYLETGIKEGGEDIVMNCVYIDLLSKGPFSSGLQEMDTNGSRPNSVRKVCYY